MYANIGKRKYKNSNFSLILLRICKSFRTFAHQLDMNAYELAYNYVQQTNRCIFLTGKAGTGKTTFLRRLKRECQKQLTVVAPTGVAAINAEGVTIHSLFQLPPQMFLPTDEARRRLFSEMQMRAAKQRVLRNLELLVIDEVSMVRADLLDTIDAVLRHFKHQPHLPFGGVQVLFIGDLFQLSPVAREEEWRLLQDYYDGPYFFQARVFRELRPVYIELDHVFRQTNSDFVEILNQVRNNSLTIESLAMLNSRVSNVSDNLDGADRAITLSTHNAKVDAINQREMDLLKGKAYQFQATIKDTFPESMFPMEQTLTLKVGARVMFIKNDSSTEKLYYNGKLGVVTSLSKDAINVICDDGTVVDVHMETWENIRYISETGSDIVESEVIGSFTHYPLRLAWDITIHKAQGLTFDHVIIDAADAFAAGQVYVALSRCRTLEGIVLLTPIPSHALTNAREVLQFTQQQVSLDIAQQQLASAQGEYLSILLCSLFNFRELIDHCYALNRMLKKMTSVQNDNDDYIPSIIASLEDLQRVGERFQQQLRQLVYQSDFPKLQERLQAANGYYSPLLKELTKQFLSCPLRSNDKSDATLLKQTLTDIYALLARIAHMQSALVASSEHPMDFSPDMFFKLRQSFRLKDPNFAIYTTQRKVRVSAAAFQSVSLLKNGHRISEIAKLRGITQRTVIKHLRSFLEDGVIELSDFHPADRFWVKL